MKLYVNWNRKRKWKKRALDICGIKFKIVMQPMCVGHLCPTNHASINLPSTYFSTSPKLLFNLLNFYFFSFSSLFCFLPSFIIIYIYIHVLLLNQPLNMKNVLWKKDNKNKILIIKQRIHFESHLGKSWIMED